MKEIQAENPIEIKDIAGGVEIVVPGDLPPKFTERLVFVITFFMFLGGYDKLRLIAAIPMIAWVALCYWDRKRSLESQIIQLANGKLIAKEKSFDISKISSVEFGNGFESVPQYQHTGSVYVPMGSGTEGALDASMRGATTAGAVIGDGLGRAAMGAVNMSINSEAKKKYYVRIVYGTEKFLVATKMREIRALALYKYLTEGR